MYDWLFSSWLCCWRLCRRWDWYKIRSTEQIGVKEGFDAKTQLPFKMAQGIVVETITVTLTNVMLIWSAYQTKLVLKAKNISIKVQKDKIRGRKVRKVIPLRPLRSRQRKFQRDAKNLNFHHITLYKFARLLIWKYVMWIIWFFSWKKKKKEKSFARSYWFENMWRDFFVKKRKKEK